MRTPPSLPLPARISAGLLLLVAVVPGLSADAIAQTVVTGADGVEVRINDTSRIASLGGAVTETVFALGLGDRVVGVDLTSIHPPAVHDLPQLGLFRQTSAEGILSLQPTLVLSTTGLGPPPVAQQLRAAGVPVLLLEEAHSAGAAIERLRTIARVLDREAEGDRLVEAIERDLEAARLLSEEAGAAPRVLFIYARGASNLIQVAGRETTADAVIRLAGGTNVVTDYEGYRPLTAEAVVGAAPDVIVIPERGLTSIEGIDGLLKQPGIALTPAGRNRRVVSVDDALLLSFGPRLGQGVLELARQFVAVRAEGDTR